MKKKTAKRPHSQEETLVVFLLDRTGSMSSIKAETIGGFNGYLDELQKKKECEAMRFHFVQFDSIAVETVHDCVPLAKVDRLNDKTYVPRANTPLYDAIGKTIRAVESKAKDRKVLFVVSTDGQENASSEFNLIGVKALIKEKEDRDKWTFSYIGIGPDAWLANANLSAGTLGASNVLRATRARAGETYACFASATMVRHSTAGGQCVSSIYDGKQLDKDKK